MGSLETKEQLNEETIDALQDLTKINLDSSRGFQEAANVIDHERLATLFRKLSLQRAAFAEELQKHVIVNMERPMTEGSWAACFHQSWMILRSKLSDGDPAVVLTEIERGEDFLKRAYSDILTKTAGSAMNDLLLAQYASIKQDHDSIRGMREMLAAAQ